MSVTVKNPSFQGDMTESTGTQNEPKSSWRKTALRAFAFIAVVGLVSGIGFVAGRKSANNQSSGSSSTSSTAEVNAMAQAQATLQYSYQDESNLAFTSNLTAAQIIELLDTYEADPDSWDDQFMTSEIMEALKTLRDNEQGQTRELRETSGSIASFRRDQYRELALSSSQTTLATKAWSEIETTTYPNEITYESDRATVYRKADNIYGTSGGTSGYICWVIAEESGDVADWAANLDTGSDNIMSIKKYTYQAEACGCETYTWWWCSKYYSCSTYQEYEEGYDGFVKAYNAMRLTIYSRIQSTCGSNDRLVLAGYSRGAGILNALAYVMYKDSLWTASKMVYVNFGSPRTLSDSLSDEVHGQFEQLRLVYEKDPVPSIPYGWMGYKHFGTMKCNNCGYTEGRDAPSFSWAIDGGIGDHTSYGEWF